MVPLRTCTCSPELTDAVEQMINRLRVPNPNVQLQTIKLLSACVANCGREFRVALCSQAFAAELKRLLGPHRGNQTNPKVQEELKKAAVEWRKNFAGEPQLHLIDTTLTELQRLGVSLVVLDAGGDGPGGGGKEEEARRAREKEEEELAMALAMSQSEVRQFGLSYLHAAWSPFPSVFSFPGNHVCGVGYLGADRFVDSVTLNNISACAFVSSTFMCRPRRIKGRGEAPRLPRRRRPQNRGQLSACTILRRPRTTNSHSTQATLSLSQTTLIQTGGVDQTKLALMGTCSRLPSPLLFPIPIHHLSLSLSLPPLSLSLVVSVGEYDWCGQEQSDSSR